MSSEVLPVGASELSPWQRSWLYWAPGDGATLIWMGLLHASGLVGLFLAPLPTLPVLGVALGLVFVGGLGTTVAYHRSLAHASLRLNPVVEQVLIFFAVFNGSGAPCPWVANHRLHHRFSDTEGDISSPKLGGFWWSHLRWLWQAGQASSEQYCPDMLARPRYASWTRWQPLIMVVSLFGALPFGVVAWAWIGPLRLLYALHVQCTVNSIAHMDAPSDATDSSRNVPWLAPVHLLQGENWHRNHHAHPAVAALGRLWWQADIGWYVIQGLERLGLAHGVRHPASH